VANSLREEVRASHSFASLRKQCGAIERNVNQLGNVETKREALRSPNLHSARRPDSFVSFDWPHLEMLSH
jgi:hypothetical protein